MTRYLAIAAVGLGLCAAVAPAQADPRDRDGRHRGDLRWAERPCCDARERRAPRRRDDEPNGPIYQSQEQVQQSMYDFSAGRRGNIKEYWRE
ncbi:hypothetical protein ACFQ4O_14735 [Methylopila musalis]|uniref:Uncharacterized protein n=1 Tax=Methylopila musalis TaxID=1134781 RepID=A0ABW3ZA89_9HYPH